jgi:hypothetical protein
MKDHSCTTLAVRSSCGDLWRNALTFDRRLCEMDVSYSQGIAGTRVRGRTIKIIRTVKRTESSDQPQRSSWNVLRHRLSGEKVFLSGTIKGNQEKKD